MQPAKSSPWVTRVDEKRDILAMPKVVVVVAVHLSLVLTGGHDPPTCDEGYFFSKLEHM